MATQYDIDRATFVRQEYRYATALNAAVKSRNASAMSIQINTQLDQAAAEALAAKMLADGNQPRVYEIEVEGIIDAQTLVGGVPTWIVNTIQYAGDSKALKLFSLSQDYENNRSTIRVRG